MKVFCVMISWLFLSAAVVVDNNPVSIKGHIDFSNAACGNNNTTKRAFAGCVIKVVDEMNPKTKTASIKTNGAGDFTASLKPGTYNIYLTKKINKALKSNVDVACSKMMRKSYGQIVVSKSHAKTYRIILSFECSPCKSAKSVSAKPVAKKK